MSLAAELEIPETGAVFTFGRSHFADNEPSHFFIKNDPVVGIGCGDDHTAVVCRHGRVFAFGSNGHGQLGLGHKDLVDRPACLKWLKPRKARLVACGRSHTIVFTDNNQLFATGDNGEGQLGIGNTEEQLVPQFVEIAGEEGGSVKEIAAGAEHSLVLMENGKAYASGSNSEGQLGVGENIKNSQSFARIALDKAIKSIACGYYHSVVVTDDGEAYVFGDNENQRLGVLHPTSRVFIPTPVAIGMKVSSVHCGQYHTLLIAENGAVFGVGSNEQGQLGLPRSVIDVNHPTEIGFDKLMPDQTIIKVACGATHTAFVTSGGHVYTCGNSAHQKLCHEGGVDDMSNNNDGTTANQYMPKKVEILEGFLVEDVACGGCHTIISAKKVFNGENNNITAEDISQMIPVHPELPPLQKIPPAIMNKTTTDMESMSENMEIMIKSDLPIEVHDMPTKMMDNINGNGREKENDKHSLDSLEPYVSGSHILEINDLDPAPKEMVNEAIQAVAAVGDDDHKPLVRQQTVVEIIEKTVAGTPKVVQVIQTEADKTIEAVNSFIESEKNKLQVPEAVQHSPIMSTKSDATQKSAKSSNGSQESDHETIACNSEKSSPTAAAKLAKTQAVIPILRSDEVLTAVENKISDEADVIQSKVAEGEGRISKFFSSLKNESCIGKGRTLSTVDMKAQAIRDEAITTQTAISDHTNSRACIIL